MTQAVTRTPADVLREARRRDSERKRDQVFRAVDAMKRDGTPITFAAVARQREGLTMARLRGRSARIHRDRPFGSSGRARSGQTGRPKRERGKLAHRPRTRQAGQPQASRSSLTASRRPYVNDSALNSKLHPLSRSGVESMNSSRRTIATAAKISGLQQNSMMLAPSFVLLKMTSRPHGQASAA